MIQLNTCLPVCDNSGVHLVRFISKRGKTSQSICRFGRTFLASVRRLKKGRKHKIVRKEKLLALVVRTARNEPLYDGSYLRYGANACVLIKKTNVLAGTRVLGPLNRALQKTIDPALKLLTFCSSIL